MAYNNSPIKEALFDIRVEGLVSSDIQSKFDLFKKEVEQDYSREQKISEIVGTFSLDGVGESQSNFIGFQYANEVNTRILQARADGFTYNVLRPYDTWEVHFSEFLKYWNIYKKLFSPPKISRIATRFINRIEVPVDSLKFEDYFVNIPPIPPGLPKKLNHFFMQVGVPCGDGLRNAIFTQTIEPVEGNTLPFIIDVDVSQEENIGDNEEDLVSNFLEIRRWKNLIFEQSINDSARKLFN